jgi:hypothetical protein
LRALLNAGFQSGSTIPRCVGKDFRIENFDIFCPKVLAGIGELPDTVADRSIPVRLRRRASSEKVARFRRRDVKQVFESLRLQLERWAQGCDLCAARPELPDNLDDRAADAWEPLLAIADHAGGDWPKRARLAAVALSGPSGEDADLTLGSRLLTDLRSVWRSNEPVMFTRILCERLNKIEEAPWGAFSERKGIDARALSRLLRPYGIRQPHTIRIGGDTAKGYQREDFVESWARYSPPPKASDESVRHTVTTEQDQSLSSDSDRHTVTDETAAKSSERQGCDGVTDEIAEQPGDDNGQLRELRI